MLDRQINLFKIDTSSFMYPDEREYKTIYDSIIIRSKEIKKEYGSDSPEYALIKRVKHKANKELTEIVNKLSAAYVKYNKEHEEKKIRQLNRWDLYYIDSETNEERIRVKKVISAFESTLTRSFGIKIDELTTDIFIVEVYYYNIAEDIIVNGFDFDGKHYVYFSSSAGQIRTKKTVFVAEDTLNECQPKLMCGLTVDEINRKGGMNVNKYLAYLALCNSATDLWEDVLGKPFDIDRTIVVDDFETLVKGKMDYIDSITYEIEPGVVKEEPIPHTDGCGMISSDYCKKNFMVRLPFIKGLLGSFDFKRFIDENNCSPIVRDIWGEKHDILKENIEVIFTKSQLKMYKFYDSWEDYKNRFKKYECEAGICNFEEDRIPNAQINYQMMQTLYDASEEEVEELCASANKRITSLTDSVENMLWFFHAVNDDNEVRVINSSYFEKSLGIYPELLNDPATKQDLKDCKNSYIRKYRSAKLDVRGKYTFVLPDLYAFCEWLFKDIKNPIGLLEENEVYCRLYYHCEELDCLRSPHLYIEHPIRKNVCGKKFRNQYLDDWFTTDAIYTSIHDLISRVLQFDVDGDKLLVLAQKNIIEMAKRVDKNVYPLYYEMGKASAVQIDNEQLYKGLTDAFKGGKIGAISNNITKIWNSGEITEEQKTAVKWLCMETNFNIDYAKTLYKPERPEYADKIIKKYTKKKVPFFFQAAKQKRENQCENIGTNIIDLIYKTIKENRNMFNRVKNLAPVDYHILLKDQKDLGIIPELNKIFDKHNKHYGFNLRIDNKDKRNNNINAICQQVKDDLYKIEKDEDKIICSLVRFLYEKPSSRKKKLFWMMYGEQIYNNIKININSIPSNICMKCGKRTEEKLIRGKCFDCRKKEIQEQGFKLVKCIDCGKEMQLKPKERKIRCDECNSKYRKKYKADKQKEYRKKQKSGQDGKL